MTAIHPQYPSPADIDAWCDDVWALAQAEITGEVLPSTGMTNVFGVRHTRAFQHVRFTAPSLGTWYGYWQEAVAQPAPLLVHVPGYGAEMSAHPELTTLGFNVLHVCPLGYVTPDGPDLSLKPGKEWPVLPDTIRSRGREGYRLWLAQAAAATRWGIARSQPNRYSFFGTSQGGGGALLLSSLHRGRGVRCCAADVPFLTNWPIYVAQSVFTIARDLLAADADPAAAWRAFGLIDTVAHAHRLELPVLLTAGGRDTICPPDAIAGLFARLPATRSLTHLASTGHRYTQEFLPLAAAWFRLYA
jgi:cephalosporin-C deacetylase-like acetyl esterase